MCRRHKIRSDCILNITIPLQCEGRDPLSAGRLGLRLLGCARHLSLPGPLAGGGPHSPASWVWQPPFLRAPSEATAECASHHFPPIPTLLPSERGTGGLAPHAPPHSGRRGLLCRVYRVLGPYSVTEPFQHLRVAETGPEQMACAHPPTHTQDFSFLLPFLFHPFYPSLF